MGRSVHRVPGVVVAVIAVLLPAVSRGGNEGGEPVHRDLTASSLEELMSIQVTSVSRKEQKLSQVAAAVYVITQEDIRRSGVTSIPEALRLAPGVQVARIDASKWAISVRGFNGRFANKVLVLIDGRSVYTNLYSGVYWDQNDVMVEDIERIEVIRGPGATMWGANAVNGVINVITKTAKATEGALVSIGTGTDGLATTAARYGGKISDNAFYRYYGKHNLENDSLTATGQNAGDRWQSARFGGRIDWDVSPRDSLTMHGDGYIGRAGQSIGTNFPLIAFGSIERDRIQFGGGYGLVRWTRHVSDASEFSLQTYFTSEDRDELLGAGDFRTLDFDFQHRIRIAGRNDLTWGLGYRRMSDHITGLRLATFDPAERVDGLYSSFVQDDITLIEDRLTLTVGSKFQHNAYSGFEYQPSVRMLWAPNHQQSFWTAVSRAVRTPSRRDTDLRVSFQVPGPIGSMTVGELSGSSEFRAEVEQAYEAGFRTQASRSVALDVAAFYNRYRGLQGWVQLNPFVDLSGGQPRFIVPVSFANKDNASTKGLETSATWTVRPDWKLSGSYSLLEYSSGASPASGFGYSFSNDNSPQHQYHVRSSFDLTPRISFDVTAYYVGQLQALAIPAYLRLDSRVGLKLTRDVELSIGGQNLLDDRHPEFKAEDYVQNAEVRRSAWLRLMWVF